ncbi:hypothetical protein QBC35DRAFT_254780 [Podospora australis]|uniref:Uncharacterized protein n=1 Tax=Podospora australis TaxID=1536484 RepID=A0AAN6WRL7_9PEZI|nr:hypothetical protein QBC35DRAFT_254780 [Podospora australis]
MNDTLDACDEPDVIPEDETEGDLASMEAYQVAIRHSPVFSWLTHRIEAPEELESPSPLSTPWGLKTDSHGLISKTGQGKRFRIGKPALILVEYRMDWDLAAFYSEQQYGCLIDQALVNAVTITGYGNNVQAATCAEYVKQT